MDISILILLAVILVAVAVLVGFLLATVLGGKSAEPSPQVKKERLDHRISFFTDRQLRRIILQLDGRTIQSPHLLKEDERHRLVLLYHALKNWLNLESIPIGKQTEETHETQPSKVVPELTTQISAVSPAQESTFPELPNSAISTSADQPAKKGVADWLAQALQPKSSLSEPPRSIAVQVDAILQRKLQERGWHQQGIRLLELPNKGMVVLVGLDQYTTVDEVPDAEIRALIRASVNEWEAKMVGG